MKGRIARSSIYYVDQEVYTHQNHLGSAVLTARPTLWKWKITLKFIGQEHSVTFSRVKKKLLSSLSSLDDEGDLFHHPP